MKVEIIKINFDNETSYKYKPFKHCCNKLKDNPYIDLQHEYIGNTSCGSCEKDNCDDCSECDDDGYKIDMMFRYDDTHPDPWEDYDTTNTYFYPIDFCPFCGEQIEIDIIGEEDWTEEYLALTKQRNELNEKRRKTDSKKKEAQLSDEICELDKKIEEFYHLGEYKKRI